MLAVRAKIFPAVSWFLRQIAPSVVATLIAAIMIAGYNHAFSGRLAQPRMAALHAAEASMAPAVSEPGAIKPPAAPVTEVIEIYERAEPERLADKDADREAGKDQPIRLAAEPAPAPARVVAPAHKSEPRPEPRRVASIDVVHAAPPVPVIVAAPVIVAPPVAAMPVAQELAQQPPPVVMAPVAAAPIGPPPMVTVPDRANARPMQDPAHQDPAHQAQAQPPAPPHGPIGTFVNAFKPSNWFARAREFGEKIEQAGNDILPNIRQ